MGTPACGVGRGGDGNVGWWQERRERRADAGQASCGGGGEDVGRAREAMSNGARGGGGRGVGRGWTREAGQGRRVAAAQSGVGIRWRHGVGIT